MGDEGRYIPPAPDPPKYDTRHDSLKAIAGKVTELEASIMVFIKGRPTLGATCDEIEVALDLSHQTCSSRIHNLMRINQIKDSGSRRKTRSGRGARVYVAV